MSKEWTISDSQKQHFTTNLVAGEIQKDQLKDAQTSEHRNRQWCLNRKSQKKKKNHYTVTPWEKEVLSSIYVHTECEKSVSELWRNILPPSSCHTTKILYDVITQKIITYNHNTMENSNPTLSVCCYPKRQTNFRIKGEIMHFITLCKFM
jgi:hypothetical protein